MSRHTVLTEGHHCQWEYNAIHVHIISIARHIGPGGGGEQKKVPSYCLNQWIRLEIKTNHKINGM